MTQNTEIENTVLPILQNTHVECTGVHTPIQVSDHSSKAPFTFHGEVTSGGGRGIS